MQSAKCKREGKKARRQEGKLFNRPALLPSCPPALILIFTLINFILPVKADVMPYYVSSINSNSIGVYQATNNIKIYKEPNENSKLLLNISWSTENFNCPEISASNLFAVFLPKKELAFLFVVDVNDNEDWYQVSFNKNGTQTGWIKKDDDYRFLNWRTFFNLYGRKYGLYYMKDAPEESKVIYGNNVDDAKSIGKITLPQNVNLTSVRGNWLLIIAYDIDRAQKIGWIKWRSLAGEIYLFPAIK